MSSSSAWSVAVDAPIHEALTYLAPEALRDSLQRGLSVDVPLGRRKAKGVLLRPAGALSDPEIKLKNILSVESEYPVLPEFFLKWLEWVAQYYFHPVGSVMSLAFPPLKKNVKERASKRAPIIKASNNPSPRPQLTEEQSRVVNNVLKQPQFSTHLVFGVTGSGKTEIYMNLLEQVLAKGKRGLVLVPEISLTPQLVQRFAARFGDQIAVLHSQLTDRERTNQWWEMAENKKSILIGARSALFCPIENLGMIVVDEEHEASFKQEEKLKYQGRDAAIMLGKFANCPVILGSATPSLESWKNAKEGRYYLHQLHARVEGRALPQVEIIDMRELKQKIYEKTIISELPSWLSPQLYEGIQKNLQNKKQVALFLNRRGVAPLVICQACGFVHECPNCDISLTLHGASHLVCHYCDYHENFKELCPDCKEGEMSPLGLGTELLEKEIHRLFPGARVARADRDEITNRADLEELIENMEKGEIDILVGTQMIAKGLDFSGLNLVGLVLADIGFNIPDFRSPERSFQLVTQVSGRSGRHVKPGEEPGQVIVQTYNPSHPSLVFSQQHDFVGFAEQELSHREALLYPPYGRLISLRLQGSNLEKVQMTAKKIAHFAQALKAQFADYSKIEILGPAQAPLSKVRGKYRYHLLLKGPDSKALNKICRHLFSKEDLFPSSVRVSADVDPLHLL
jgi:primosomal protein N' (replication factor Y)